MSDPPLEGHDMEYDSGPETTKSKDYFEFLEVKCQLWLNLNMEQQSPHVTHIYREFQDKGRTCLILTPRRDRVWIISGEAQAESRHERVYDAIGAHICFPRCLFVGFRSH